MGIPQLLPESWHTVVADTLSAAHGTGIQHVVHHNEGVVQPHQQLRVHERPLCLDRHRMGDERQTVQPHTAAQEAEMARVHRIQVAVGWIVRQEQPYAGAELEKQHPHGIPRRLLSHESQKTIRRVPRRHTQHLQPPPRGICPQTQLP